MNKKFMVISSLFSVLFLAQSLIGYAAAQPQSVTFELETTYWSDVMDILMGRGPMCQWITWCSGTVDGDFEGSFTWIFRMKTKASSSTELIEELGIVTADCTLIGEIAGKSGELELEVNYIYADQQRGNGRWRIISGTDDLADLQGGGRYTHGDDLWTLGFFEGLIG